jgi:hypothetical protein
MATRDNENIVCVYYEDKEKYWGESLVLVATKANVTTWEGISQHSSRETITCFW